MSEVVIVDHDRCQRIGEFIRDLPIPEAREEVFLSRLSPEDVRMLFFSVVAICHQASPIGKPRLEGMIKGKVLYGWDYLVAAWVRAAEADPTILKPLWLFSVQPSDIVSILYDYERHRGSNIHDPHGRAVLLQDIGAKMIRDGVSHVDEYYRRSRGYLWNFWHYEEHDGYQPGLESLLVGFDAYGKDPVKKKITLFLILMRQYGFWHYLDSHHLGAPIDYHEVRLHLRLGTVRIQDAALGEKIAAGKILTEAEDVLIRAAISNALFAIANASGISPAVQCYLFWNIARNCCRRDETHCQGCEEHPDMPDQYRELLLARADRYENTSCLFNDYCESRALPHNEKPREPVVETDFY